MRSSQRPPLWKMLLNSVMAVGLVGLGLAGAPAPAQAAGNDIGAQLTNVEFKMKPADLGEVKQKNTKSVQLELNACVPKSAGAGDSWTLDIGENFDNAPTSFVIANPHDEADIWIEIGYDKDSGIVKYTLTPSGADTQSLCFNSNFGARYKGSNDLGERELSSVNPGGGREVLGRVVIIEGTTNAQNPRTVPTKAFTFQRSGDQCRDNATECLRGVINLPAGDNGVISVRDVAQPSWAFHAGDGVDSPRLFIHTYDGEGNVSQGKRIYPQAAAGILTVQSLTPDELEFTVDTTGLKPLEEYYVQFPIDAKYPNKGIPTKYSNDATVTVGGTEHVVSKTASSTYVGGAATGAFVKLVKKDASGADANTAAEAAPIQNQNTGLVFTVINTGTQSLTDFELTDEVIEGGTVQDLSCTFPDKTTGTTWAGPLESTKSFECTAQLVNVTGAHHNVATISAKGEGEVVTDSDPYFGQGSPRLEPAVISLPKVSAPECTAESAGESLWETVTAPKNTASVSYGQLKISDAKIATLTATANAGYTFKNVKLGDGWQLNRNGTATWSQQLNSVTCDSLGALAQPEITVPECSVETAGQTLWESVTAPANTKDITYGDITVSDEHVATLTAQANAGFTLRGAKLDTGWTLNEDGTATWSQQLNSVTCDSLGALAQPQIQTPECSVATAGETLWESVVAPTDTDDVTYGEIMVGDDNVASVTATVQEGFMLDAADLGAGWVLNEDGTATWSQQLSSVTCDSLGALAQPEITVPECSVETAGETLWESATAPVSTDSITYGELTVDEEHLATLTATVAEGFMLDGLNLGAGWVLNEDGTATWSQQLSSVTCDPSGAVTSPTDPELGDSAPADPQTAAPLATTGGVSLTGVLLTGAVLLALGIGATVAARRTRAEA